MPEKFADKVEEIRKRTREEDRPVRVLPFPADPTYSVPASTQAVEDRSASIYKITRIIVHFPPGPNGLVDLRIDFDESTIIPIHRDEWINKDAATIEYVINRKVDGHGDLKVTWRNRDTVNEHRVPVDIEFTER